MEKVKNFQRNYLLKVEKEKNFQRIILKVKKFFSKFSYFLERENFHSDLKAKIFET